MKVRGFETLLRDKIQAPIIVTFHQPDGEWFDFEAFYAALGAQAFELCQQQNYEAALPLLQQSAAMSEAANGPAHQDTLERAGC